MLKTIYQNTICTIFLGLFYFSGMLIAADSDNFSLTVTAGKPAATPNPATINKSVTFSFGVSLYDSQGKRIEEIPAEVKQITYTVNSAVGTITTVVPNMAISTDIP
jgi:hypothetical protein